MIARGLIKPSQVLATRRERVSRKSPEERAEIFVRTEILAKQLYNVFVGVLVEKDADLPERWEISQFEEVEDAMKDCFRAQAKYVLSTYHDNERLRARVKEIEERRGSLPPSASESGMMRA